MAEKLEIEVLLSPDGGVKLVTRGLKGQACAAETEALEKALGTVARRERTAEWYQQPAAARAGAKTR